MRSLLPTAAAAWNRFWFRSVDGTAFALVRIGVAAAGLQLWSGTLPLVRQLYSDAGEMPIEVARSWSRELVGRWLMPDAMGAYPAVAALFALWGLALVALGLGWRTRLAAWVNWACFVWLFHRNLYLSNGGDEVFRLVSLYLAFGYTAIPASRRALSLDRRGALGAGTVAEAPHPVWPLRFVQIQIAVVYLVAGFWKVVGPPWWDGSAIHIALNNPAFSRFGAPDWGWLQLPYLALGITVAWWEFLFPALVAGRRTRRWTLAFGVALHGGILLLMNIGVFPFVMLACYPAFLDEGGARRVAEGARRVLARLQPSAARSASAASAVAE